MINIIKTITVLAITVKAVQNNLSATKPDCKYGPVTCGFDYVTGEPKLCEADQACANVCSESGCKSYCFKIAPGHCKRTCPEGQTLNPVEWCECIDIDQHDSMFCASKPDAV